MGDPILAVLPAAGLLQDARVLLDAELQMFFTALTLGFGLLHLILYAFSPEYKSNLFYGIFLLCFAAAIYFDFESFIVPDGPRELLLLRFHRFFLALGLVFALRFIYEIFLPEVPRRFRYAVAGIFVAGALAVVRPEDLLVGLHAFSLFMAVETVRLFHRSLRRRQEGVWIVGLGFVSLFLFSSYDILMDVGVIGPVADIHNAYPVGAVGLFIATSVYLARDVARTNRRVREHEVERRLLEIEMARQANELEEARALQLAMLPRAVPAHPDYDIAVHMQTATEVGGDYYDFHLAADGTLTVAVGDATGHGLKAGMMVAVAKSLFKSATVEGDLRHFFRDASRILKQMNLGNLFMALTLVRLQNGTLTASAAGMPPLLVHRAATGTVDAFTLKGMPLGAFPDFPYQEARTALAPGDTLLLLTDGFPECFNADGVMMGYDRVGEVFRDVAPDPPDAIIRRFLDLADAWTNGEPPGDDVTFVVVRRKAYPEPSA